MTARQIRFHIQPAKADGSVVAEAVFQFHRRQRFPFKADADKLIIRLAFFRRSQHVINTARATVFFQVVIAFQSGFARQNRGGAAADRLALLGFGYLF